MFAITGASVALPASRQPSESIAMNLIANPHTIAGRLRVQSAFGSEAGKAAAGDVPKFATGGADLLIFDTKDV